MSVGVAIVGAGPGVRSLHLPTLARLGDAVHVAAISDAGSGRAAELAERWGGSAPVAPAVRTAAEAIARGEAEVALICSPPEQHADHALAAIAAGARGVLVEKPLAVDRDSVTAVIDAARSAGTALAVGTNHHYDHAWNRAGRALRTIGAPVTSIAVTVVLPPNERYHALVADHAHPPAPRPTPPIERPEVAAAVVHRLVMGLAVHDLPAVRDLAPSFEGVEYARALAPLGYAIGVRASGVPVTLTGLMLPDGPDARWRLAIATTTEHVEIDFPPAFVHAGSARVRLRGADGHDTVFAPSAIDSYEAQWRAFMALVRGEAMVEYDELAADAMYALDIADGAAARILEAS